MKYTFDKSATYNTPSGLGGSFDIKFVGIDNERYQFKILSHGWEDWNLYFDDLDIWKVKGENFNIKPEYDTMTEDEYKACLFALDNPVESYKTGVCLIVEKKGFINRYSTSQTEWTELGVKAAKLLTVKN